MLYYLYKKMMEEADEEFQAMSEEQKERDIYLHKHKYLGWLLEKPFIYAKDKENTQNLISNTISKIYFSNDKVVNWSKIKKLDKDIYEYFSSDACNNKAFTTTLDIANLLKDSKIKIVWMSVTSISTGHKSGYAVLKKGNYVYDTNLKRTYKFKNYMKCRQAVIFKEFSLNKGHYFNSGFSYKNAWQQFEMWCKEF